eukprot:scaffold501_cov407-Prasinococcus_capsulatus_cf.AAC.6
MKITPGPGVLGKTWVCTGRNRDARDCATGSSDLCAGLAGRGQVGVPPCTVVVLSARARLYRVASCGSVAESVVRIGTLQIHVGPIAATEAAPGDVPLTLPLAVRTCPNKAAQDSTSTHTGSRQHTWLPM